MTSFFLKSNNGQNFQRLINHLVLLVAALMDRRENLAIISEPQVLQFMQKNPYRISSPFIHSFVHGKKNQFKLNN